MAWRFRRTVKLAPGIRLNFNKGGPSVRVGPRGAGVTVGSAGTRVSAGIPGTGFYAYQQYGRRKGGQARTTTGATPAMPAALAEPGTAVPIGWALTGAFVTFVAIVCFAAGWAVAGVIFVVFAGGCALAMYQRLSSPCYRASKLMRRAAALPPAQQLQLLGAAATLAPESLAITRALAHAQLAADQPGAAVATLQASSQRHPGRPDLALDLAWARASSEDYAAVLASLEPLVGGVDPETTYGQQVLTLAAVALRQTGQAARGLEVVRRTPLRRRNLDDTLKFSLLERARCALATGKKADARRDLDRLYSVDPGFPGLSETVGKLDN